MTRFGSLVVIAMAAGLGVWACGGDDSSGGGNGGAGGADASADGSAAAGGSGGAVTGGTGGASGGGTAGSSSGGGGAGGQPAGGTAGRDAGSDAASVIDASAGGAADASADGSVGSDTDAGDGGDAEAGVDPCSLLTGNAEIQSQGTVSGTGTYSSSSPENVRDGLASTSWWTAQTFGTQTFTWENDHDECIDSVILANTSADELYNSAWKDWGFDQVVVRVRNQAGDVVWTVTQPLPGSPDSFPSWMVGGKLASKIELEFSGFSEAYGGFSELQIIAKQ